MTRQLPTGLCIEHALTSVRNNIGYAFRISWPWYVVLAVVNIGILTFSGYAVAGGIDVHPVIFMPIILVIALINMLAFASIAVNWHRYILLDQVPTGSELFRLDGLTWRYFGNILLIGLIVAVAFLLLVLLLQVFASLSTITSIAAILIGLAGLVFASISIYRLSVKLPAVALGRRDFSLSHAWAASRGNKQPIFFVILFQFSLAIGIAIAFLALDFALALIDPIIAFVVSQLLQIFVGWLLVILGITILTSLYGFFVEGRDF
ncbi:hypothetical protein G5V57_03245 [Nordella sp. HKS 07]|uniref:hypothetical protein n=1 Tax=Nordella sp. HKS 07 TaxID=2712222 RepID=UPI0013E16E1A|nr:hypothetical protein [Nordella sp. HKS 07]QIG46845.1 hypothetical protein G5V57_03245 [Nordella sp. HKS 07]